MRRTKAGTRRDAGRHQRRVLGGRARLRAPDVREQPRGLVQAITTRSEVRPSAFVGRQVNTWGVRDALKDTDTMGWTAGRKSVATPARQVADFPGHGGHRLPRGLRRLRQVGPGLRLPAGPEPGRGHQISERRTTGATICCTCRRSGPLARTCRRSCGRSPCRPPELGPRRRARRTGTASGPLPGPGPPLTSEQYEDSEPRRSSTATRSPRSGNNLAFYSSNPGAEPEGLGERQHGHLGIPYARRGLGGRGRDPVRRRNRHRHLRRAGDGRREPEENSDFDYWVTRTQSYLASPATLP